MTRVEIMENLNIKLLKRAIGQKKKHAINSLYADKSWAEDLDIVNELGGHTGCVNALSWSKSGSLLASGSDDQYLNIWDYNPANIAKPFSLNTSVSTGHSANIFSVKFMPHSNDRTVITCAGDSEVRVFDLEYGGLQGGSENTSASTRSRRFNDFFANARWLDEANTNTRVYRSHADRAKRIVTESSPYLFLTCSEDGEVRQWDLRQPSSSYPSPHGTRRMDRFRATYNEESSDHIPPPLISYKRYQLDLNSISCSGTQPHYIALGGAHLHCFLHDRRMLGRDISREYGRPASSTPVAGTSQDEIMRESTKCIRRFAPNNKRKMKLHDSGHITACKISDARPHELIASWSGDHIYSFDIIKSPDATEKEQMEAQIADRVKLRNQSERKRKRAKADGSSLSHSGASRKHLRRIDNVGGTDGQSALRVHYENGESEDIPIGDPTIATDAELINARDALLTEAQRQSERVARSLVQLRRTLFDFSASINDDQAQAMESSSELTPFTDTFTRALGQAVPLLSEMDQLIQGWSYPVNPTEDQVQYQNTLRHNRQSGWRFVQAAGVLSTALGGRIQTTSLADDPRLANFSMIKPASREGKNIIEQSRFCYDFLRAILLWLNGGLDAVLEGFRGPSRLHSGSLRYPLSSEDTIQTGPEKLRDYLLSLATSKPIIDLGRSRFERSDLRAVFESQHAAVQSFYRALTGIELRVNQGISGIESDPSRRTRMRVMDKGAAARFWGLKVGRSLLMEAAPDVTYAFIQQAFGGPRIRVIAEEDNLGNVPLIVSSEDEERVVESLDLVDGFSSRSDELTATSPAVDNPLQNRLRVHAPPLVSVEDGSAASEDGDEEENESSEPPEEYMESDDDDDDDDDDDSDDSDEDTRPLYRSRAAFGRSRERANVNLDVPYSSHTKTYKGHCNTRTVKDVNYYGLDDEYIVSGSDDGHFFIWDRKTCQIINILEGDGEVVNVVQGHPYEPLIACSGIDSTIKIFGPGARSRDRQRALRGLDIANAGASLHSSLQFGRMRRSTAIDEDDAAPPVTRSTTAENHGRPDQDSDEDVPSRNGLKSRRAMSKYYQITSQNDAMRRQGAGDALVTEGMLARFATILQRGELQGIAGQGLGGAGATIVLDDNCLIM